MVLKLKKINFTMKKTILIKDRDIDIQQGFFQWKKL